MSAEGGGSGRGFLVVLGVGLLGLLAFVGQEALKAAIAFVVIAVLTAVFGGNSSSGGSA